MYWILPVRLPHAIWLCIHCRDRPAGFWVSRTGDQTVRRPWWPSFRPDDAPLIAELARDGPAGVVALARATGWPQSRVSARLAELHAETTFGAAVTGTANLLVTVTCRDLAALYTFVTAKIGTLPAVRQVEIVPVLHRLKQAGTRVRDGRLAMA